MKNAHKLLLLLIVTIVPIGTIAVNNFKPGTLVTLAGDTLSGFIEAGDWDINPSSIRYCSSLNDSVVTYLPTEIRQFQVDGDFYVGCEIEIETSPRSYNWLSTTAALQLVRKTVFLRALVTGPKSLYYYKESENFDWFYIKQDNTYQLLAYKKYNAYPDDIIHVTEQKRYIGQLIYYLNDQPKLANRISKIEYNMNSIVSLFDQYYKNSGSVLNSTVKKNKDLFNYGLSTGVSINSIHFSGSIFPELFHGEEHQGPSITPAIFFELVEPRNHGRWSLYNELLYSEYKYFSLYDDGLVVYDTKMTFGYASMYNLLRYKFQMDHGAWFVNGGSSCGLMVREVNLQNRTHKAHSDWNYSGKALDGVYRFEFGLVFGVGYVYKQLSLELRYKSGAGMSPYKTLRSETRSSSLVLSYRF